jgi:hypothetical protein
VEPYCRAVAFVDLDAAGQPFIQRPLPVPEDRARYLEDVVLAHDFGVRDVYWALQRDLMTLRGTTGHGINAAYADRPGDPEIEAAAMRFLLTEMARETRDLGARLVVVYIPIPGDVKPPPDPLLAALAVHEDVALVDMTAPFTEYEARHGARSLWASTDDSHPNAAAHALIADALEPIVRAAPVRLQEPGAPHG